MRYAWLAALAALFATGSASAQTAADVGGGASAEGARAGGEAGADPSGGGPDDLPPMMRDPRQLSGVPRGEPNDPPGRLTVRAVQGAFQRSEFGDIRSKFPAGAKIHLVGYRASGEITLRSVAIDDGGRAVFDRLATDQSQTYVALAVFPRGEVEDRLVSQPVTMPPEVGIRMILAGEAQDSGKPPVDDLVPDGSPILQVSEPGVALVYPQGETRGLEEMELLEAGVEKPIAKAKVEVVTRADRRMLEARFTGLPSGADKVYVARVVGRDRPFLTLPFQLTATRGAGSVLFVAPPVLFAFHGGANLDDERLFFQLQISIYNASLVPFDPGPAGLVIPLPAGFSSASVEEEVSARVKVDEDRGLVWRGRLATGERRFLAAFALPAKDGVVRFDMPMPYGLWNGQLSLEKVAGVRVAPPGGARQRDIQADDGRPYVLVENLQLRPDAPLRLTISGLPQYPRWKTWAQVAVGLAVLGLLGWGTWGVAARRRREGGRIAQLEADREELFQALVQLEADQRRQRVTEPDYERRRGDLVRQLEGIYAQLAAEAKPATKGEAGEAKEAKDANRSGSTAS